VLNLTPLSLETNVVIPEESSKESAAAPVEYSVPENLETGFVREDVADWLRAHESELLGAKLENCCKRGRVLSCPNGHRWGVMIRCDLRICPHCLKRLGRKVWDIRAKDLASVSRGKPGWSWKMLTLTVKTNGEAWTKDGLRERLKKIWECGRKLLREVFLTDKDAGAVGVTEVGSGGNVHIHVIVWGRYASQESLSRRWEALTKDSKIVDIRKVKGSLRGALGYVGKYLSKLPGFVTASQFGLYLQAIAGHRRIHVFGCLIGKPDPELARGLICTDCGLGLRVDSSFYERWHHPPWDWILQGIDGVGVLSH